MNSSFLHSHHRHLLLPVQDEGHLRTQLELPVPGGAAARSRVSFRQMDPCCLSPELGAFDAVLLSGVLEQIPSPKAPLGGLL